MRAMLTGNSFEDLKSKIDALPKKAKPIKMAKPAGLEVVFEEYKGFFLRKWSCKPWVDGDLMTRYDTAYEVS